MKYHLGASSDREFDGNTVHLSLTANPSHLEIVNPVVEGSVRLSPPAWATSIARRLETDFIVSARQRSICARASRSVGKAAPHSRAIA